MSNAHADRVIQRGDWVLVQEFVFDGVARERWTPARALGAPHPNGVINVVFENRGGERRAIEGGRWRFSCPSPTGGL